MHPLGNPCQDDTLDAMKVTTMNVSLPPRLAELVRERVEAGLYSSTSEVVREALRRLLLAPDLGEDDDFDADLASSAVEAMRRVGDRHTLGREVSLRDLIDEGRRR